MTTDPSDWMTKATAGLALLIVAVLVALGDKLDFAWVPTKCFTSGHHPCQGIGMVEGAKATWAFENHKTVGDPCSTNDLSVYFGDGRLPACSLGGHYILGAVGEQVVCTLPEHALWRLGKQQQSQRKTNTSDPLVARAVCRDNLRLIEALKNHWAQERNKKAGAQPSDQDLFAPLAYLRESHISHRWLFFELPEYHRLTIQKPRCPAGGVYTLALIGQSPRCSVPSHTRDD